MSGYFFNMKKEKFADIRVRRALMTLYDFEAIQRTLLFGQYKRVKSYFPNLRLWRPGCAHPVRAGDFVAARRSTAAGHTGPGIRAAGHRRQRTRPPTAARRAGAVPTGRLAVAGRPAGARANRRAIAAGIDDRLPRSAAPGAAVHRKPQTQRHRCVYSPG